VRSLRRSRGSIPAPVDAAEWVATEFYRRGLRLVGTVGVAFLASGCVSKGYLDTLQPREGAMPVDISISTCIDRTRTRDRDLGGGVTAALREQLSEAPEFVIRDQARFRLFCEVTTFVEGSLAQRLARPGSGATVGQVATMLTDTHTNADVLRARSNTTVDSSSVFTAGADQYILSEAVRDVVARLREWAAAGLRR